MNTLYPEIPLNRRRWVVHSLATLGVAILAPSRLVAGVKVGDPFPNLGGFKLEGTVPDTSGKVVLVDFWASWCIPCRKAFPVLKELHEKYSANGLVVIGVSVDEDKKDMDSFLKKNPVPFSILRDPKSALPDTLGVEVMPTSYLIDTSGNIHAIHSGFDGEPTRKKYIEEIGALMKGKTQ